MYRKTHIFVMASLLSMSVRKVFGINVRLSIVIIGLVVGACISPLAKAAIAQPIRLVCAHPVEPRDLQPAFSTHMWSHIVSVNFFNALMMWNSKGELVPDLATGWEVSPDGLTITFFLPKDVKWHDGKPFTSADVKFSFEQVVIPFHPAGKTNFALLKSIDTPDDYTVKLNLKSPSASIMSILYQYSAPISAAKHIYEGTDIQKNPHNFADPIGTGPYKLKEWKKGDYIVLTKNTNYFKKNLPYFDEVLVKFMPDTSAMALALEKGEVDYLPREVPVQDLERLKTNAGIKVVPFEYSSQGGITLHLNMLDPVLGKVEVRQALSHAIDRKTIVDQVMLGYSRVCTNPLDYYVKPSFEYEYSVAKANALLDKAGFPKGADGTRFKTILLVSTGYAKFPKAAQVIRDQFKAVGVDLELKQYEDATFLDIVYKRLEFQMAMHMGAWGPDPGLAGKQVASTQIGKGTFTNCMSYKNPELDGLLDEQEKAVKPEQRKAIFAKIVEILQKDLPVIPITKDLEIAVMKATLEGLPPGPSYRENLESARFKTPTTMTTTSVKPSTPTSVTPSTSETFPGWIVAAAVVILVAAAAFYGMKSRSHAKTEKKDETEQKKD